MEALCDGTVAEDGKSTARGPQTGWEPVEGQLGFGSCTGQGSSGLGVHIGEDSPSLDVSLSDNVAAPNCNNRNYGK